MKLKPKFQYLVKNSSINQNLCYVDSFCECCDPPCLILCCYVGHAFLRKTEKEI